MPVSQKGFALVEAMVVLALIGILAYIAYPYYQVYLTQAAYRSSARELAGAMRQARAEAISQNREFRLQVTIDKNGSDHWTLEAGDRAANANTFEIYRGEKDLPPIVRLAKASGPAADCAQSDETVSIRFRANGTTSPSPEYLCILNPNGEERFRVGISSPSTGLVEILTKKE